MQHPVHRVASASVIKPFTLRLVFEDKTLQVIDLRPVLEGELFGPLQDHALFEQVAVDPQAGTVVWPNGADFDPAMLHDWPSHKDNMVALATRWRQHATTKSPMIAAEKKQAYGTRKATKS